MSWSKVDDGRLFLFKRRMLEINNNSRHDKCDNTSSQCLFFIKCFLSSFSRNIRIRSRSERLSRSRSLMKKSRKVDFRRGDVEEHDVSNDRQSSARRGDPT